MHDQAVGVDVVIVVVGPGDQPFAQLLREMRGRAGRLKLALELDAERPLLQALEAGRRQHLALDHLGEHGIAPRQRALGIEHRVVVAVALEHADQGGALQHVERVCRGVEIGARRHLDAVGVIEKGHGIEIGLEDFLLAVEGLDLERGDRFLQLAGQGRGAPDLFRIEIARQLLGQGRAALALAGKGVQGGTGSAPPVDAVMLVEAVILGRNQRLDHGRRDVAELDPDAVGTFENGQFLAVDRQDARRLFHLGLADVVDTRRQRNEQQDVEEQQERPGGQRQEHAAPGRMAQAAKQFDEERGDSGQSRFEREHCGKGTARRQPGEAPGVP